MSPRAGDSGGSYSVFWVALISWQRPSEAAGASLWAGAQQLSTGKGEAVPDAVRSAAGTGLQTLALGSESEEGEVSVGGVRLRIR